MNSSATHSILIGSNLALHFLFPPWPFKRWPHGCALVRCILPLQPSTLVGAHVSEALLCSEPLLSLLLSPCHLAILTSVKAVSGGEGQWQILQVQRESIIHLIIN